MRFVQTGKQPSEHTGMEFCCDFCNRHPIGGKHLGYYVYLDGFQFPSYWVCPVCKKDLKERN